MADTFATSFGVLNYSGMLFNKGNVRTPLSSIIGSKAKTTNHVEFVTGQEYTSNGNGSQPGLAGAGGSYRGSGPGGGGHAGGRRERLCG